uniref:Peroxisomal membrane protein 11C n=1 Tax=Homalodisca liturata TaxID=320908 RepID=A0A1B6JQ36_9HEMI
MECKRLLKMLESHSERDKLLRFLCYTSQLIGGVTKQKKYSKFSHHLSECRTTLRLLDDVPMLMYSLSYGLGKKEPDTYMQVCGVIVNILDQLYYPLEHVAWAADKGILSQNSEKWWLASNVCWALSLYFNIARSLRYLHLLNSDPIHLHNESVLRKKDTPDIMKKTLRLQLAELIAVVCYICDFINAIHWMPEGFLWGGRLKQWQIGALGMASTLLSFLKCCTYKDSF